MNKVFTLIFLSINLFTFGQSSCEKCKALFKSKDFANAKNDCILASQSGDPTCQAYLGIIYLSESDIQNARIWFEKSANSGNPHGQNGLGYLYQNGMGGLPKDLTIANGWFLKSAEQGNSDSQFWLGENLFLSGNKAEGYKWTLKASLNGSSDAQFNLGAMLYNGDGINKDESLAYIWFLISATNGNEKSKKIIDNLKVNVTDEQFQNYIKEAKEFKKLNPQVIQ
jgi:TPR repeat protein